MASREVPAKRATTSTRPRSVVGSMIAGAFWLFTSLVIAIVIDWAVLNVVGAERGIQRVERIHRQEVAHLGALSIDRDRSARRIASGLSTTLHDWLCQRTGLSTMRTHLRRNRSGKWRGLRELGATHLQSLEGSVRLFRSAPRRADHVCADPDPFQPSGCTGRPCGTRPQALGRRAGKLLSVPPRETRPGTAARHPHIRLPHFPVHDAGELDCTPGRHRAGRRPLPPVSLLQEIPLAATAGACRSLGADVGALPSRAAIGLSVSTLGG